MSPNPYHLALVTHHSQQGCMQSARLLADYERTGILGAPPSYGQSATIPKKALPALIEQAKRQYGKDLQELAKDD